MTSPSQRIIQLIKGGDPLSASQLFNPIINAVNFRSPRGGYKSIDATWWFRCRNETGGDRDPFGIFGVRDVEIDHDGITLLLAMADETHELLAGNENYPLIATTARSWCKIVNEASPVRVKSHDAIRFLDDLVINGTEVALPLGTGTPSGSGGIQPNCHLWALSPELAEAVTGTGTGTGWTDQDHGMCYVMAGRRRDVLLFQSAEQHKYMQPLPLSPSNTAQCYLVHPSSFSTDFDSALYTVNFSYMGSGFVFPGFESLPVPAVICWARLENGVYYATNGGTPTFYGTVVSNDGTTYQIQPNGPTGTIAALSQFDEPLSNGQDVRVMSIGGTAYAVAASCPPASGT